MRSNSFWVVTRRLIRWRLEAIHTKTHMYCIVLANCPHGTWQRSEWKRTFLKTGLRVEKNAALSFSCGRRIRILSETMTPSPHPSTSSLRPLNPATSHNNNGELLLVFMFLACSVSSSLFLVNFKRHLEACNMNYRVFCHFQWIRMDVNILETMLRKMEGKKDCFSTCGPIMRWNCCCDLHPSLRGSWYVSALHAYVNSQEMLSGNVSNPCCFSC